MPRPLLILALVVAACASPAPAQTVTTVSTERQIYKAFEQADYARALTLIEAALEASPEQTDLLYNGACAHARLGQDEQAVAWIRRAIAAGFRDYDHMLRDPDLASIRDVLEAAFAQAGVTTSAPNATARWRERYGETAYRYDPDPEHNLVYATALDATSHAEMRRMLDAQADQMMSAFFGAPPVDEVLIAVPTPADAKAIFGDDDRVGGMYMHTDRRLISRDIGSSLRHEFFHAFHWGHMQRLGKTQPLWIQEGLAALYEDYELEADGTIRFLPNGRHNITRRRVRSGRALKWSDLFGLSSERFMKRAGQLYPQVRSMFAFVADEGKLEAWYTAYVEGFDEDPTGAAAFEAVFAQPVTEVERSWRRWVADRPVVDNDIDWGDASLGVESTPRGSNDGVLVDRVIPGSAAAAAGLHRGDVIVAIDGTVVRSLAELRALVAPRDVGDEVELRVRRNGDYVRKTATLKPLAPR